MSRDLSPNTRCPDRDVVFSASRNSSRLSTARLCIPAFRMLLMYVDHKESDTRIIVPVN